jgi:gamma-glutamyl:cysteine ligase YbdK (ATP-grasp superfamily)
LIENALEIIQLRKKNKDLVGKNETIVEILEQKKEMFLVTMTHGIIEKEIENLTGQTEERAKALQESNQILERDKEDF